MTERAPASWHPDPFRRHELRYWNGAQWTEHVSTQGNQGVDPVGAPEPPANRAAKRVQRDVKIAGATGGSQVGGGTPFTEQVLVVSQKPKLMEISAEYTIYDQQGRPIGAVREVGQSLLKKAVRVERYSSHRLHVVDLEGRVLLTLTKPVPLVRLKVMVRTADGAEIGEIVQKWVSVLGKMTFALEAGGEPVGSINGEDGDSWDFNIQDAKGNEVARITKTSAGLAKEIFTKSDNYVVNITRPLEDPLRSLVIAAALALDTMLRQGA